MEFWNKYTALFSATLIVCISFVLAIPTINNTEEYYLHLSFIIFSAGIGVNLVGMVITNKASEHHSLSKNTDEFTVKEINHHSNKANKCFYSMYKLIPLSSFLSIVGVSTFVYAISVVAFIFMIFSVLIATLSYFYYS